jgi:hypothetical protein
MQYRGVLSDQNGSTLSDVAPRPEKNSRGTGFRSAANRWSRSHQKGPLTGIGRHA